MTLNSIVLEFERLYKEEAKIIALSIIGGTIIDKTLIIKRMTKALQPIIDDMFAKGMAASNQIVSKGVAELVVKYDVPFKYNKDLLLKMNEHSIFTGYYDVKYKSLYSKSEIDRLKRVILSGKYGKWDEIKTISEIRKTVDDTVKMTVKRAQLLARHETARLTTVTNNIYFQKKVVRDKYELVLRNNGDNVRPTHKDMNGDVADDKGMFYSPVFGLVQGPPLDYGCKCSTYLRLRK